MGRRAAAAARLKELWKTCSSACSSAWAAVHVERHGKYSIERLHQLSSYRRSTSLTRAWMVIVLTPLPSLVAITLLDAIPLQPPSLGLRHSHLFWLRLMLVGTCLSATVLVQIRQSAAQIPITNAQIAWIATTAGVSSTTFAYGMSSWIGYPLPFAVIVSSPAGCFTTTILTSVAWNTLLRNNVLARSQLIDYIHTTVKEITLAVIYPLYNYIFNRCRPREQSALALVLPVMKLATKNWINVSAVAVDDLKPEIIVLNVEVFHTLFVIYSLQSATTFTTIVVLVGVDFFALGLALHRFQQLMNSCSTVHRSSRRIDSSPVGSRQEVRQGEPSPATVNHYASGELKGSSLHEVVLYVLEIGGSFRHDASVGMQLGIRSLHSIAAVVPIGTVRQSPAGHHLFHPKHSVLDQTTAADFSCQLAANLSNSNRRGADDSRPTTTLTENEKCLVEALSLSERRQRVDNLLKLLHMTEFLLLVEYTEVMIPVVYCLYLLVMSNLPNRMYYAQFKDADSDALQSKIANVLLYLTLELASFLLVSWVLSTKLAISGVHQLAFVLEKQWSTVQAKLLLWIVLISQLQLEHNGVDYTFQFKWLRSDQQQ